MKDKNLFWIGVEGGISNGKTTFVKKMINFFLSKSDINVCGFYQPCLFKNNERKQYLLDVIDNDRKIHEFILANRIENRKVICPYEFNQEAFEKAKIIAKNAKYIKNIEKPVIIFLDEIGYIETQKGGHYDTLMSYVESFKEARKIILVLTYTDIRKDCVENLLKVILNAEKLDFNVNIKSNDINEFCENVYEFLTN